MKKLGKLDRLVSKSELRRGVTIHPIFLLSLKGEDRVRVEIDVHNFPYFPFHRRRAGSIPQQVGFKDSAPLSPFSEFS